MPDETVLLTGCCRRSGHVLFRVLDTPGGLVVDSQRFCAGREYETWTPRRRALAIDQAVRYGCPCRQTALILDGEIRKRIQRGQRQWTVVTYSISRR